MVGTTGTAASAAPSNVSVSHVDTVGFPYVDLVVGGLPGFGLGPAPAVRITQDGAPLRTTSTWELSPANPLAVVVDAPAPRLARAQGLVAELVQELPPSVPIALTSVPGGGQPGLDRDAVMSALSHQAAHRPTTLARGLAAAESAGVQHILVITTCAGPAPQPAPAGVAVDVVGVGPACTDGWLSLPRWGAGRFTRASSFDAGLAGLDAMVARWRSSVLAVTQALTHHPLVVSVGSSRLTAALSPSGAGAGGVTAAPSPTAAAAGSPTADGTVGRRLALVVGLVLLVLAGLLALVWRRRHRAARADASTAPAASSSPSPASFPVPSPAPPPAPPAPAARPLAPTVIDLRDRRPAREVTDVRDERVRAPRMAVATEQLTGHSEVSPPAVVARVQSTEESPAVAAQTPDTAPTAEAQLEPTSAEVPREVTDDAPAEETPADESPAGELADVTEGQAAEAPPVEAPSVGAPSAEDGFQVRSEFTWTKLEFAPLVWQYDREPQTVDIRDEADGSDAGDSAERSTVDVRDEAVHKSRRRKARR